MLNPPGPAWSSAGVHIGKAVTGDMLDPTRLRELTANRDSKRDLQSGCSEQEIKAIRVGTAVGRPLGTDNFISKLENVVGRRLRPLPVGRPKKKGTKK